MKNWLIMFRPETYEIVKTMGLIGVKHQNRVRFGELTDGDRFVAYVSRQRVVDGYGTLASEPYEDGTPVWSKSDFYTQRCKVRFDQTGARQDAKKLLWELGCWPNPMKTTPSNYLFCMGGFIEISDVDYDLLTTSIQDAEAVS